jgi:hypothetical protein
MANGTLAVSQLEILTQSGTGIITVVPPVTNTNRTLTLPDATGTVALQGGAGVGKVLQVVNATSTTGTSTTSATLVTTGRSASITPTSSSSKVLVQFQFRSSTSAAGVNSAYAIYRGATNLTGTTGYGVRGSNSEIGVPLLLTWLDSPATTSSTTYTLYFSAPLGGTNGVNINNGSDFPITINLLEIAA